MSEDPTKRESPIHKSGQDWEERLIYVLPERMFEGKAEDDAIGLGELWNILWRGKWLIISIMTAFLAASLIYALVAKQWYRSEVLLAPADEKSSLSIGGQLGGLAALAGVDVGGGSSAEDLAVLKSRDFIRAFILENELMPILFQDKWDSQRETWAVETEDEIPDIREGVERFQEDILKVREERDTGLVAVAVEWNDPELAARWAADLVRRLNDRLRERALLEAERNVAYLREELGGTSVVTLQQSIGRLLESELHKLMLARGNEEFAFRVVDPAEVPQKRIRPRRLLVVLIGAVLGAAFSTVVVLSAHFIGSSGRAADAVAAR